LKLFKPRIRQPTTPNAKPAYMRWRMRSVIGRP
jgi:hypothetical protein